MSSPWVVPGYTEIRELGRSAAGRAALAWHDPTGTPVVIRYLDAARRGDAEFMTAYRVDAQIMSEVDDPCVARVYEYVESVTGAALVMELVDGVSLREVLAGHGPLGGEAALAVLKSSLLGLAVAHQRGVVHGDYRPEHVLIDTEGRTKLTDFGLFPAGHPDYLAPERAEGGPATVHADLYAATATLVECLTGAPPVFSGEPVVRDGVPAAVGYVIDRGLGQMPADRPIDAHAFLVELEAGAVAAYGDRWEEVGRDALAQIAADLAVLLPADTDTPDTQVAPTPAPDARQVDRPGSATADPGSAHPPATAPHSRPDTGTPPTSPTLGPAVTSTAVTSTAVTSTAAGIAISERAAYVVGTVHPGPASGAFRHTGAVTGVPAPTESRWSRRRLIGTAVMVALVTGFGSWLAFAPAPQPSPTLQSTVTVRSKRADVSPVVDAAAPSQAPDGSTGPESTPGAPGSPRRSSTPPAKPPVTTPPVHVLTVTSLRLDSVDTALRRPLKLRVRIRVSASSVAPITVLLHHEGSADGQLGGADTLHPTDIPVVLSGSLSYDTVLEVDVTRGECRRPYILVAVRTTPEAPGGAQVGAKSNPNCAGGGGGGR